MASAHDESDEAMKELRAYAFGFPGAVEEHPWDESVAKVAKKIFVFFGRPETNPGLAFGVKLPHSAQEARRMPYVTPSGYGLGKSGWVSVEYPRGKKVPLDLFKGWIEESYRAIAPKRLVATPPGVVSPPPEKKAARRPRSRSE